MRGDTHFAFEDRNMAPVPNNTFIICSEHGAGRKQSKIVWDPLRARILVPLQMSNFKNSQIEKRYL